ncbi:DUF4430 domain-containing protein [[Eubacterium] hominis]|uniref:DUF4430 domain-containing protein n=1 Tax=[Eubacterium] hominis TaxID=2764325 RepID=UPI003A4D4786
MHKNHKKRLQLAILAMIIIVSFSFLFVYANSSKKTEEQRIAISSIDHLKQLIQIDEQTEKKTDQDTKKEEPETTKKETEAEVQTSDSSNKTPSTPPNEKHNEEIEQPEAKKYATISIDMRNILTHVEEVGEPYRAFIPTDGVLLASTKVEIEDSDTAYSLLDKVCKANGISLDANQGYVKYINQIGEFDAGTSSGWLYKVNGTMPNVGSNAYHIKENDVIEWRYSVKAGDI